MEEKTVLSCLELLKLDLGVKNTSKDGYYNALIESSKLELERKGIEFDERASVEDAMLIADYAAWKYRKREENVPLSENLQLRIRNRIVSARAKRGDRTNVT